MALIGPNGHDLELNLASGTAVQPGVLAVTERTQTFTFKNVTSRPVPSLLRGFSAPVNVTIDLSDADLAFLMRHDSDLFNRWKAANRFATRTILNALSMAPPSALEAGAARYAAALAAALENPQIEDAYKAELLKLPSQSDIAREKASNVDHAAIDQAHRTMSRQVATNLSALLEKLYAGAPPPRRTTPRTPRVPDAARSRNATLTLLTSRGTAGRYASALSTTTPSPPT